MIPNIRNIAIAQTGKCVSLEDRDTSIVLKFSNIKWAQEAECYLKEELAEFGSLRMGAAQKVIGTAEACWNGSEV